MTTAITRRPAPSLQACQLTFLVRQPINYPQALAQHESYCAALEAFGLQVISLPPLLELPDSPFVEDCAVVLDELAVLAPMGSASRQREPGLLVDEIAAFRPVFQIEPPAALEGGDVLRIGRSLYTGLSSRTDKAGAAALQALTGPHGYRVVPVEVCGSLHLKTACTALDDETVLLNPEWVDAAAFSQFHQVAVPVQEPWAANVLRLENGLLASTAFPRTLDLLGEMGYRVRAVDNSEFLKAEAGLTCLSLIFPG